jgi:hypothetical protein
MNKMAGTGFNDQTTPDVEKEYNDWYDHQRMPDVLRVPRFMFAFRSRDLASTNAENVRRMRNITVPTTTMCNGTAALVEPVGPLVVARRE